MSTAKRQHRSRLPARDDHLIIVVLALVFLLEIIVFAVKALS